MDRDDDSALGKRKFPHLWIGMTILLWVKDRFLAVLRNLILNKLTGHSEWNMRLNMLKLLRVEHAGAKVLAGSEAAIKTMI